MENKALQRQDKEKQAIALNHKGDYHALYLGYGTSTFERMYNVYHHSKLIGALYSVPRLKNTAFTPDSVVFKVANDILYTENWYDELTGFISGTYFKFSNITRMDIALDGANHMLKFFTQFVAGRIIEKDRHYLEKVGKIETYPKAIDLHNGYFDGFQMGSRKSERHVIIYNKSEELKKSGKDYINRYWIQNGIEKVSHDYMVRTEISLKSKKMEGWNIERLFRLTDKNQLVSLFQSNIQTFLDFRYNTDTNISRCAPHALIDYRDISLIGLPKAKKKEVDDMYKIKMSIHADFLLMCKGLANGTEKDMLNNWANKVELYGLQDWYFKKREEWKRIYACHANTGHVYEISQL